MPNVDFEAIAQGMTMAVPFAGHLGLEITEMSAGEATVRLPAPPGADQPRRQPARRRPLHPRRDRLRRRLCRRLRRPHGRRHPARPPADINYEKIAEGPITAHAKLAVDAAEALATLDADGKVEFPCEIELTDESGTRVATATVRLARPPQREVAPRAGARRTATWPRSAPRRAPRISLPHSRIHPMPRSAGHAP